ncbi:KTSC domain-containing protein [Kitasatospora sp. LaBMicrA B282]|uniref:KTSC domain-containing protein n=1 Tax=Kitasatospora sp. LaBMicrA B282 TaxID=3420949 RepID=UPI003D0B9391
MDRRPVESSCFRSVGHDPVTEVLELEFTSGSVYRYAAVPAAEYRRLLAAESLGRCFHQRIRDRYRYRRVC